MKTLVVSYDESLFTEKDALYLAHFGASTWLKDPTQDVTVNMLSSPKHGSIDVSLGGTFYKVTEHPVMIEKRESADLPT